MRVLLDTNVIISAVTTRGLCADVFRAVVTDHELIICSKILQEVRRILQVKFSVPESVIAEYLELLEQDAILAESQNSRKADVLVTGDREVQDIKSVRTLRILSPRTFWEELTAQHGTAAGSP